MHARKKVRQMEEAAENVAQDNRALACAWNDRLGLRVGDRVGEVVSIAMISKSFS